MNRWLPEDFLVAGEPRDRLAAAAMLIGSTLLLGAFALARAGDLSAVLQWSAGRGSRPVAAVPVGDLQVSGAESLAEPAQASGAPQVADPQVTDPQGDALETEPLQGAPDVGSGSDHGARREVRLRPAAAAHRPSERSSNAELVAGFRDDDVRFNAERSAHHLRQRGAAAVPELAQALRSDDVQQRSYALGTLWVLDPAPFPELIDRSFAAVGRRPEGRYPFGVQPASMGVRYLARHAAEVAPWARRFVDDADPMRAFFAAYVLGRAGDLRTVARAAPRLIEHLADNHIQGDALMACHGLAGFGASALPFVEDALPGADAQARPLLEALRAEFSGGRAAAAGFGRGVTRVYRDPLREYDPGRSAIPRF